MYPPPPPPPGVFPLAQEPKGMAVAALVMGILSIVCCFGFGICPILGVIFGVLGIKKCPSNKGMAIAGLIMSAIGLAFWAFYVVIIIADPTVWEAFKEAFWEGYNQGYNSYGSLILPMIGR